MMERLEELVNHNKSHKNFRELFAGLNMKAIRASKGLSSTIPEIIGPQAEHLTQLNPKTKSQARDRQTAETAKKVEEDNLLEESLPKEIMHYVKVIRHVNLQKEWPSFKKWEDLVIEYYDWVKNEKEGAREQQHKTGTEAPLNTIVFCNVCKDGSTFSNGKCSTRGRSCGNKGTTTRAARGVRGKRTISRSMGGRGRGFNFQQRTEPNQGQRTMDQQRIGRGGRGVSQNRGSGKGYSGYAPRTNPPSYNPPPSKPPTPRPMLTMNMKSAREISYL